MPDIQVTVGSLRWPVIVARRRQDRDPTGPGIDENWVDVETVRADIQSLGALTFYGAAQTDTPVTHRITVRWLNYLDNTSAFRRETRLPDGEVRSEIFRVRRVKELNGRKRFISAECELEYAR